MSKTSFDELALEDLPIIFPIVRLAFTLVIFTAVPTADHKFIQSTEHLPRLDTGAFLSQVHNMLRCISCAH